LPGVDAVVVAEPRADLPTGDGWQAVFEPRRRGIIFRRTGRRG